MEVFLESVSKRYRYAWILRNVTVNLQSPNFYAVKGPNGAGKSTLLQIISGFLSPSMGKVRYKRSGKWPGRELWYSFVSIAAPYMDLIEEFSLLEMIYFHHQARGFSNDMTCSRVLDILEFEAHKHKLLKDFSSGMKQRVKVGLAVLSKVDMVCLDEPTTNLDESGKAWYHELISSHGGERLFVVASNIPADFPEGSMAIDVQDYK